jgi:hypothetical protein
MAIRKTQRSHLLSNSLMTSSEEIVEKGLTVMKDLKVPAMVNALMTRVDL